jgi:dihydroorotase
MHIERDTGGKPVRIRMRKPGDMHQHFRDGSMLHLVGPMIARRFCIALAMPNLVPPITTFAQAEKYSDDIAKTTGWYPLLTLYLTDTIDANEVSSCCYTPTFAGIKYYPAGLTTNSDSGVANPSALWTRHTRPYEALRILAERGKVLLLHAADGFERSETGELDKTKELDPYDQENYFIRETLPRILEAHPNLKVSVEHLSTAEGAEFMSRHGNARLGCSLTAQHLLMDRRDVFRGGFRPHRSWWPVIQPKEHRDALREFAKKKHPFVWLGSDSAPHAKDKKESACCAGGVLMAHAGIELYAEAFEEMGILDHLENFASINGLKFYGLQPSDHEIQLVREAWTVNESFVVHEVQTLNPEKPLYPEVIPFRLGEKIEWKLV